MRKNAVLIIYTGGTIGMIKDPVTNALVPFGIKKLTAFIPELRRMGIKINTIAFDPVTDSSDVTPEVWIKIADTIYKNYEKYDGFVVLHGTDTMAYTASALSFMLENLRKPVIFTGSQLPISTLRTDGRENLLTAIEIASAWEHNRPIITEVCLFFEFKLYRGNRASKHNVSHFNAYRSYNYPTLAEAGILIHFNQPAIRVIDNDSPLKVHTNLDNNVAILKIFPGINKIYVDSILKIKGLKAIVLETYGMGNAPTFPWFLACLKKAVEKGIYILNITQCRIGSVDMTRYETGRQLLEKGIISGKDMTTEAAITKLMFVLGKNLPPEQTIHLLQTSIAGEI